MPTAPPKLRDDLVISEQDTRGEACFVIKDPETGRFFRFGEAEHYIACQLDGRTPLEDVRSRVAEEFGATNGLESLQGFTEQLRQAGLLEQARPQNDRTTAPRRVRGTLLYLRLKAFDPDRLLDELARRLSLVFTRGFVLVSGATIVFALGLLIANWEEIQLDLYRLYTPEALLVAWLTALLVTALHEFAHGVTCKHFGRSVREMGFLLIYFQPAFYCNVSDAWLIPQRSRRMWVSFAGAYFELFLWAMATLIWRLADQSTLLHNAVLVVMATSAIKSLFNLNPLIKLDGYYALSDYLEIPNLRQRSFAYLRGLMRTPHGQPQAASRPPRRQSRIYLTYGLLAGGFSFAFLSVLAVRVAGSLTRQYQAWGFVLFVGLIAVALQHPLQRLGSNLFSTLHQLRESVSRWTRLLAACGLVAAVVYFGRMELSVSGESAIFPSYKADIRAEADGFIEDVFFEEGATVKQHEPVVRLSQRDLAAELTQVDSEIDQKQWNLRMLQLGPRPEEIDLARKELTATQTVYEHALKKYQEAQRMRAERLRRAQSIQEKAAQRLEYANVSWNRAKTLLDEGLLSRQQSDEVQEQRTVGEKEWEAARAEHDLILSEDLAEFQEAVAVADKQVQEAAGKLRILLLGSRPEEIGRGKAEIAGLEARRNNLQEQLRGTNIVSPIAGVIVTKKLNEKRGQFVRKGDLIAEVVETATVSAETSIPEKEVADVRIGQQVAVKIRADPEKSFHGTVAAIAPTVSDKGATPGQTVTVTTVLHNEAQLLKPGMTGMARISCGKRTFFDLLTRRLARYVRVEFWSWW